MGGFFCFGLSITMARAYLTDTNIVNDNTAGVEPVTVAELKNYMQLEGTAYDTSLAILLKSARKKIEKYCNVSIVPKSVKALFNVVGPAELKLPFPPQDAIQIVGWKKCPSTWVELDNDQSSQYNYCVIDIEAFWQSIYANQCGTIRVSYTTKAVVDNDIYKQAILMQAGYMFTNRDEPSAPEWNPQAKAMLAESRYLTV